jgi:mRNA interferase MazF
MKKGDVVLIPFPFSDLSGNKNRPAVILIKSQNDVTVCFITTQLKGQTRFDIVLQPSEINGLKRISMIRINKIATIDIDMVIGKLGNLDEHDFNLLNRKLLEILELD